MIVSRTPYRISFFGGGTDYPAWYQRHGGAVLATTINKYCYVRCTRLPPHSERRIRQAYPGIDSCSPTEGIDHPAVRETLRFLKLDSGERGVEIRCDGDLPTRSGMGSSSSLIVGLLHALYTMLGKTPPKCQLASEAIHIERSILKETVGSQDQVLAAHGGFNLVTFMPNDEFVVRPVTPTPSRLSALNDHLMLFHTGISRRASDVACSYVDRLEERSAQLSFIREFVDEALSVLTGKGELSPFGDMLHESWLLKRSLSKAVATDALDEMYAAARNAGARGGKLTGAGGGGFLLLFASPDRQPAIRTALQHLLHVPFRFEQGGTQVFSHPKGSTQHNVASSDSSTS